MNDNSQKPILYFTDGEDSIKPHLENIGKNIDIYDEALNAIKDNNLIALSHVMEQSKNDNAVKINEAYMNILFIEALRANNTEAAQYLVKANASRYIADPHYEKESALKHLCIDGNLPALQQFITTYHPDLYARGIACRITKSVYLAGSFYLNNFHIAPPIESTYDASTYAVKHDHVHIIDYLLNKHQYNINYQSALEVAASEGNLNMFEYLLKKPLHNIDYQRIFMLSIGLNQPNIAKSLIEKNLVDINGVVMVEVEDTFAAFSYMYSLTQEHLPPIPDPKPKQHKYTALSVAFGNCNIELIDYLMKNSAKIEANDYLAISCLSNIDIIKHLILEHNLPNNVQVNKFLHQNLIPDNYSEIVQIMERRDLANSLHQELPINKVNPPKNKI